MINRDPQYVRAVFAHAYGAEPCLDRRTIWREYRLSLGFGQWRDRLGAIGSATVYADLETVAEPESDVG